MKKRGVLVQAIDDLLHHRGLFISSSFRRYSLANDCDCGLYPEMVAMLRPLSEAGPKDLTFVHERGSATQIEERIASVKATPAPVAILSEPIAKRLDADGWDSAGKLIIVVTDARLAASFIAPLFGRANTERRGKGCVIYPWVAMQPDVTIGAYTVVGSDGLSPNRHGDSLHHTTHIGRVVIGNHVFIGPHCAIQRGVLGDTVIGGGCNLDSHVVIAHGCRLAKRVAVGAHTTVCGSCTIGNDVWVGCNSVIREGLTVGDGAFIGVGSVVVKDVPPGAIMAGNPAKAIPGGKKPW